jgi:hypothetical protein
VREEYVCARHCWSSGECSDLGGGACCFSGGTQGDGSGVCGGFGDPECVASTLCCDPTVVLQAQLPCLVCGRHE